jgi:hypothetical protein
MTRAGVIAWNSICLTGTDKHLFGVLLGAMMIAVNPV